MYIYIHIIYTYIYTYIYIYIYYICIYTYRTSLRTREGSTKSDAHKRNLNSVNLVSYVLQIIHVTNIYE